MTSRVAILGLGRSGISAAKAAKRAGAEVVVIDEGPGTPEALELLRGEHIEVKTRWKGGVWQTGAGTLVTSPGVPRDNLLLQGALSDGVEVISEVELAFRIAKDPIVAITGTNGKSTTTVMAWLCAKAAGWDAVLCGNIYGSGYDEIPLAAAAIGETPMGHMGETPMPQVARQRVLIAEISSFQLEWVDQFRPQSAVITNITPDHLNRYPNFEDYAKTKRRIFDRMGPDETAVWQAGDFGTEPPAGVRTLTFGPQGDHAWADERRLHLMDACIDLAELPFSEPHNRLNAMAAGLLVMGLDGKGADPEPVLQALKGFRGLAHRMERLGERNQVLVINNSMCTNPAAVIASSKGLERPQRLLIGGVNKNLDFAPVGEYLRRSGHSAYLFGTDGAEIARQLGGDWPVFNTLNDAFSAAARDARPGEAIMLAPGVASMDQFADFRDRGEAFRKMAKEWLNENMDQ